ncbi:hypothetical protein V5799_000302 [Amblyomma americanum]|uniref:M13 family peptidase n=1 Tax=Amblyomma americanum TaxID=6943 RepID=A0AAQ4D3F7_AMBAM
MGDSSRPNASQLMQNQGDAVQRGLSPPRWRREYQPPSECSVSAEDRLAINRPPEPNAAEEYSEGQWMKLDAVELRRRREMASKAPTQPPPGKQATPPWFYERASVLELLVSSLSSSTEDKPSLRSADDPSPPKAIKKQNIVPVAPPQKEPRHCQQSVGVAEDRTPGVVQHGTEDSHLPYWTFAKNAQTLDECPAEPQHDVMPAVLQVYDTETTREQTSSGASSTGASGTGPEASVAKGAAGEYNFNDGAHLDDSESGKARSSVGQSRKKFSAESLQAEPASKQPTAIALPATDILETKLPAEAVPQNVPSASTYQPEAKLAAIEPSAETPSEAKFTSTPRPAAGEPDTDRTAARMADSSGTQAAVQTAAERPKEPTEQTAACTPSTKLRPLVVAASSEQGTHRGPVRLQRARLPPPPSQEKPPDDGIASEKGNVLPKSEGQPRSTHTNEPEWHHQVPAMLHRIPMRLLLLDLFLAFLFVIFSHMRLLGMHGYATSTNTPSESPLFVYERPVCGHPACSSAGLNLFYTLNHSADACRSIFDMVCRPWIHELPSKYHEVLVGSERLVTADVLREVSKFLKSQLKQVSPSTSQGKLALLYASCQDLEGRDRAGLAYFRGLLRRYQLDRWPFLEGQRALGQPQRALELFTRDTGAEPYFTLRLRRSGSAFIVIVGCPLLGLPPLSFIERTADVDRYADYIGTVLREVAGSFQNRSDVPASVVEFETTMARSHLASCSENQAYQQKALKDLGGAQWNWERFLDGVTQGVAKKHYLHSASWEYVSNVTDIIVSDSVQAANHFGWKVVSRLAPYTTTSMVNGYRQFLEVTGLETHQPLRHCLTQVNQVLPFAMGRVYALKSPETTTNYEAYRVAYHVARSLDIIIIKDRQPLPPEIDSVYRKLRSTMEMTLGYPDWAADEARLDAYYEPVKIGNSYLESHISAAGITYLRSFDAAYSMWGRERLMFPEDPERWTLDPAWLNIYDLQENRFYVLPATLQPPYYVEGTAASLNYGGFGFLLATAVLAELLSPNAEQAAASSGSNFLERSLQLVRDRLAESAPRSGASNGSWTEAAAARVAYLSYHMHGDFHDDQAVRGLESTAPDQIFFINVARTLCTLARSRHYTRVVGQRKLVDALSSIDDALLSLPEYRDAFNCSTL